MKTPGCRIGATNSTPTKRLPPINERTAQLGEVLEFMRLLWAMDHGLQTVSKRLEAAVGVTGPQRLVIRIVGRFPGISAGDIAEILHIHPSTLTGVLKRLVTRGVLERRVDPLDGRRAQLNLTLAGQRLNRMRSGTVEAAVQRILDQWPTDKMEVVRTFLSTLSRELESTVESPIGD